MASLAGCVDDLNRVGWAGLRPNCGAATDVPELLRACAGGDRQAAVGAVGKLDDSLYYQGGWVCPAASAALPFLVRLAADPEVKVRVMVLDLIARIAAQVSEVAAGQVDPGWPGALEAGPPRCGVPLMAIPPPMPLGWACEQSVQARSGRGRDCLPSLVTC
jgi:hypothetical protein